MSSVGAGDQHGCPFRHNDQASLKSLLQTNGVSSAGMNYFPLSSHFKSVRPICGHSQINEPYSTKTQSYSIELHVLTRALRKAWQNSGTLD